MDNGYIYIRKNYNSLDVSKFICAILIICAHFASEWGSFPVVVDYAFSIYVIAVPFFFCCSGFLFFKKLNALPTEEAKKKYFISYQKRIWTMYGLWTLVYVPFLLVSWIRSGEFGVRLLRWIHTSIVFQTYSTIWFLPALAIGIALAYWIFKRLSRDKCAILIVALYLIGTLGYSYSFIFEGTFVEKIYEIYKLVFKTTRNGLFNALPFIYFGYLFAKKDENAKYNKTIVNAIYAIIFLLCVVVESFLLKIKFNVTGMDFVLSLLPFTYFFMQTLLSIDLKDRKIYTWLRKSSLLMFVSQRLFLTALPSVMPRLFGFLYTNSYLGIFLVLIFTIVFSVGTIALSKKIKFLKWIM